MKLIVNLNGNVLCPFQVFIDIIGQLPQPLPPLQKVVFAPLCELTTINDWINLESWGKPPALRAEMLNDMLHPLLVARGIDKLELHIETFAGHLTLDNLYLLFFLSEKLSTLSLTFYVNSEKQEQLQQAITLLQQQANILIAFKQPENTTSALENKRKQVLQSLGFNFANSPINEAQANQLIGYAWVCLKAGAYEIGTRVLVDALKHLPEETAGYETLWMHLQLTRFLSHQYAEVTQADFPPQFHFLAPNDVISLHFIKAYCATLTRNLTVAELHFKQCNVNEHMPLSDENSLYRLNLFALFQALQGNDGLAMALEMRIKEFIKKQKIRVVGLKYVNFINIARLYKKAQQFEQSLAYYAQAYEEISGGGYTTADHIYYYMNLGAVHEAAGSLEMALHCWLNAALHWLCYKNKYALSWRPRLILCQEKITDITKPLPIAKAHRFLSDKIMSLMKRCNYPTTVKPRQFQFTSEALQHDTCYIAKNIMLFASHANKVSAAPITGELAELSAAVSQCLQQIMPIAEEHTTLVLDSRNEGWYPHSQEQCGIIATINGCKTLYFNGQHLQYGQIPSLSDQLQVQLTPAINTITVVDNGLQLNYGRSFLNQKIVVPEQIALIKRLQQAKTLYCSQLTHEEQTIMTSLIAQKVLVFIHPILVSQGCAPELAPV